MLNLKGDTCNHGMRLLEDDTCDHGNVSKDAKGGDASVRCGLPSHFNDAMMM